MARPKNIDVFTDAFYITWDDEHESIYPCRSLRGLCACAECVSEGTGQRLVSESMVPENVHADKVESVGNYAIQVFWSDGHSTGIFPYERLRQLCDCKECQARFGPPR